ncbi:type II toxin-antitoxin system PemK/MazF family toxin [Isoptericola jiangsuensis]|uniref:type II toxin-antitoxin system PemK/MazF family toxin n=1 Tax=Isoptericola jiangsuensis TaxID=548579 RepID=UPI001FE530B6|nr:type II toxin-antitoxin system PemK/MazF family toxin [Isoptericola jiangsuensis]
MLSPSEAPWSVVTIVPTLTSDAPLSFRPEFEGAGRDAVFLVDRVRAIDDAYVGADPVGYLSAGELAVVEEAVARDLGLPVEDL